MQRASYNTNLLYTLGWIEKNVFLCPRVKSVDYKKETYWTKKKFLTSRGGAVPLFFGPPYYTYKIKKYIDSQKENFN